MYVYVMYNKDNDVLYVGKTSDIESRMRQHFGCNREEWKDEVVSIKYMDCYTEVDMSIYEIYLINILKPKYNMSMLYKGDSLLYLDYNLKDYNIDNTEEYYDISDEEKARIKKYLVIYEDKGKSKMNSNYDSITNIKRSNNAVSLRWSNDNADKYSRIVKNAGQYFKTLNSKDNSIRVRNVYVSMWSNHIESNKEYIKDLKKCLNSFNLNENIRVICYLKNDYISNDNKRCDISSKKSIMILVNTLKKSAIQKCETVYAYIPSSRMRDLLNKYLNNEL